MQRTPLFRTTLAAVAATALAVTVALPAQGAIVVDPIQVDAPTGSAFSLTPLGTYETGEFDVSAAEIVAFVPGVNRILAVNALSGSIDVLDANAPAVLTKIGSLGAAGVTDAAGDVIPEGSEANSVTVRADGLAVVSVEHAEKTEPGWVVFVDAAADTPTVLGAVRVGAQPDNVSLSADGRYAVTANEGEPSDDYTVDPEGSVSVVTLPEDVAVPGQDAVATADFRAYDNGTPLPEGVLVFAGTEQVAGVPETSPIAQNLEPEYAAVDGTTAYVTLQENNAVAVVDLPTATVSDILPLGVVDHGAPGNGIDASDRDGQVDVRTVEGLHGIRQPDGIATFRGADGETYFITADEGDAREWGDYVASARVKDLAEEGHGPVCADSPLAALTGDADLGRLNVNIEFGRNADGTCYEELYSLGSRGFSIFTADGTPVFGSGDDVEAITAAAAPEYFNSDHSESGFEGRSDDKGPEPENLAVGTIGERTYAFLGLERVGGVMVYDITDPAEAFFVTYTNNRDFAISMEESVEAGTGDADLPKAGDLGAEGVAFVPAEVSPAGVPLVIVGNEVSGTTTVFAATEGAAAKPADQFLATSPDTPTADVARPSLLDAERFVGDFDGDGVDTVGYREGNTFYLANDPTVPGFETVVYFGRAEDQVLVGDFDGDGRDTIAVRRGTTIHWTDDHRGVPAGSFDYGRPGDVAIVGDFDGDGADTVGLRRGARFLLRDELAGGAADVSFSYGRGSDLPLVGDWDGDGTDTVGVHRDAMFLLVNDLRGGDADVSTPLGRTTDQPVAGAWTGGADSIGVLR